MIEVQLENLFAAAVTGSLKSFAMLKKPVAKYWCNRHLSDDIARELKAGEEQRNEVLKRHVVTKPDELTEACVAELNELGARVVSFPGTIKVSLSDIDGSLTDTEMAMLEPFIDECIAGKYESSKSAQ